MMVWMERWPLWRDIVGVRGLGSKVPNVMRVSCLISWTVVILNLYVSWPMFRLISVCGSISGYAARAGVCCLLDRLLPSERGTEINR